MRIEPFTRTQLKGVLELALRAWAPVFVSIREAMDGDVYESFYPDWRVSQRKAVADVCADPGARVWIAIADDGAVAGFVAVRLHADSKLGEIYMLAVDPQHQRQGVGAALTAFALGWMKDAGMSVAMVETGFDPGHAPARATYESAGFRVLPAARYFKKL